MEAAAGVDIVDHMCISMWQNPVAHQEVKHGVAS